MMILNYEAVWHVQHICLMFYIFNFCLIIIIASCTHDSIIILFWDALSFATVSPGARNNTATWSFRSVCCRGNICEYNNIMWFQIFFGIYSNRKFIIFPYYCELRALRVNFYHIHRYKSALFYYFYNIFLYWRENESPILVKLYRRYSPLFCVRSNHHINLFYLLYCVRESPQKLYNFVSALMALFFFIYIINNYLCVVCINLYYKYYCC